MKVLIIDDSRAVQLIIKRILHRSRLKNLETKLVASGKQALSILETWLPDLVLLDLHMPDMSGLELLKHFNEKMLNLNVGFITTETDQARLEKVRQNGAKFIINKPFNDRELVQKAKLFLPQETSEPKAKKAPQEEADPALISGLNLPSEEQLEVALAEAFFRDVKVQRKPYEKYDDHHYPYLLGMMTPVGKDQVKAICLLKQPAIKQISNAFASLYRGPLNTPQDRAIMCDHFFRLLETFISQKPDASPIMFKKSNLITKPYNKISEFYNTRGERKRDYFIEIKGFDAFVVTLVAA